MVQPVSQQAVCTYTSHLWQHQPGWFLSLQPRGRTEVEGAYGHNGGSVVSATFSAGRAEDFGELAQAGRGSQGDSEALELAQETEADGSVTRQGHQGHTTISL